MRSYFLAGLFGLLTVAVISCGAQVPENTNYQREIKQAESLLADTSSTDIPHHVHYDLKLYDREGDHAGHASTATYDIYRDPAIYTRIEIKAGGYEFTHIANVHDHKEWLRYTGIKPLRLYDFEQAFDRPKDAMGRFSLEPNNIQQMQPQQLEDTPLLCANDNAGTAICFNPLIHLFAYAQMFNHTIMYDRWLPIGAHTVPGSIRVYQDKKLLLEATGTVEAVKKFPEHFMEIPETPSQIDPDAAHKIAHSKPVDITQPFFGNIEVSISVDEKGHVKKAEVLDSDDKRLEGIARKAAHHIVYEPQMENGQPVPFDTVIYLVYYPYGDQLDAPS